MRWKKQSPCPVVLVLIAFVTAAFVVACASRNFSSTRSSGTGSEGVKNDVAAAGNTESDDLLEDSEGFLAGQGPAEAYEFNLIHHYDLIELGKEWPLVTGFYSIHTPEKKEGRLPVVEDSERTLLISAMFSPFEPLKLQAHLATSENHVAQTFGAASVLKIMRQNLKEFSLISEGGEAQPSPNLYGLLSTLKVASNHSFTTGKIFEDSKWVIPNPKRPFSETYCNSHIKANVRWLSGKMSDFSIKSVSSQFFFVNFSPHFLLCELS